VNNQGAEKLPGCPECSMRYSVGSGLAPNALSDPSAHAAIRRAKNGSPSVHPMQGDEIRALRRLQRECDLQWSQVEVATGRLHVRTPASRGDSQSGSWLRPDGRSGWTSWRPPSSARSRPSSDTRGCELRNLR